MRRRRRGALRRHSKKIVECQILPTFITENSYIMTNNVIRHKPC